MIPESVLKDPMEEEQEPPSAGSFSSATGMDPLCRFAAGIAHDFNNLLTVINGYCELLLSETPDPGKSKAYAMEISRAGEKATEIVELVLAYGGKRPMQKDVFEVNTLMRNMRGFLAHFLGESISLSLHLCSQPCRIRGDREQLQWALMNLLTNSKEAMPEGGRIDLKTRVLRGGSRTGGESRPGAAQYEISVRDTGRGMVKEVLERIFDPYFSTKNLSSAHGQGLGLACTKGIVRQFGGGIIAESAPGAGTIVRIRLPIPELA